MTLSQRAWSTVAILWVIWLLNQMDRQLIFTVFPLLRQELSLSDVQLGLLGSSFLWVYAVANPIAGYLADRLGRKRVIVASLIVWSLITWATAFAGTFGALILARALMGLSEACFLPPALAMLVDYHGPSTRSRAIGLMHTGGYTGIVLGGALGGWVAQTYGWRSAFVVFGIVGLFYALLAAFALREAPRGSEPSLSSDAQTGFGASIRELLALPGYKIMLFVFAGVSIANWVVTTWMPSYLFERFGMSLAGAGFSATFYLQAGTVVGLLASGVIADRLSRRTDRSRVITQAAGLGIAFPALFLTGIVASPVILFAALALFGAGRGAFDCNLMPALSQIARPQLRSTAFGFVNMVGCLAGGFVAVGAGALKSVLGLGVAFSLAGLLLCLAAFLLYVIARRMAQREAAPTAEVYKMMSEQGKA